MPTGSDGLEPVRRYLEAVVRRAEHHLLTDVEEIKEGTAPWVVLLGENGGDNPEELLRWLQANREFLASAG